VQRLVVIAYQQCCAATQAFGKIGQHFQDDLTPHPMRAAQFADR
jgi:hypothetical protein